MDKLKRRKPRRPYRLSKRYLRQDRLSNRLFPYTMLLKLQHFFLPRRWVQDLFFPRRVRLVRELAATVPGVDIPAAVLGSLMANTGQSWRNTALMDAACREPWITVKGFEQLENALTRGRGVILVQTHAIGRFWFRALLRARLTVEMCGVGGVDPGMHRDHVSTAFAFQLAGALKTLKSGGIVNIAGEGLGGHVYLELPFLGHLFPFRAGFAELAVHSGAAVMALFGLFKLDGKITFELVDIPQPVGAVKEEQVETLVRGFATLLQEREQQLLASLRWGKLAQIRTFPPAT